MNNWEAVAILFFLALVVFMIFIGPIFTIWSINVLFGLQIPITLQTWLSVAWLHMVLYGIRANLKRSNGN